MVLLNSLEIGTHWMTDFYPDVVYDLEEIHDDYVVLLEERTDDEEDEKHRITRLVFQNTFYEVQYNQSEGWERK